MFMASWNRTGFDSSYPEYYPDMELGSAMAFRRGISYVREKGGFSTLYINARIFDVTSDFHASVGEQMAIRTPEGRMIEEVYGPARFTVNCPDDELWQNYLIDTADFAAMAYGCKGIYLDQLASAEPYACYNEAHSHGPCTGGFNRGYLRILRTLLERLRARDPEAYLMTENCGDIYSAYCWGSLTWNGDTFDEFFNLFKYTFPEYVQVNMVDPRGWVGDPEELRAWFYKDMAARCPAGEHSMVRYHRPSGTPSCGIPQLCPPRAGFSLPSAAIVQNGCICRRYLCAGRERGLRCELLAA